VLVFVVAYHAERHLCSVFERVPAELFNDPQVDFLVIDDASNDAGPDRLAQWVAGRGYHNVTVLRNPVNQGYGGNQKLGYRYAVDNGYDFVILLHGDGQYPPEMLPTFIEQWRSQDADVVLGSRMQKLADARKGGMPLYKMAGNRILTTLQNKFTGRRLSEYHTGYRGYSTRFLRSVQFEINTNDFHFDTEILLQAFHVDARVVEFAIPTRYGDEVCHVNGMRYARDVVLATLQYKMHQFGMLCSLKYRDLSPLRYRDKTPGWYTSHAMALREVKARHPARVLDIGCGPGFVAAACRNLGVQVTGIDAHPPLPGKMDHFVQADLDQGPLPQNPYDFDMVLLLDVIEHLQNPERFLLDLRELGRPEQIHRPPAFVISTPNIAFATVRLNLLLGRFNYAERGILDITHKRLFTKSSLRWTLEACGYRVESIRAVPAPFTAVMPGRLGRTLAWLSAVLARVWGRLFAFQFLVVAYPLPGVQGVLKNTARHTAQPAAK
jgi:glycosyltransferase involved in cell wall biosynthesis